MKRRMLSTKRLSEILKKITIVLSAITVFVTSYLMALPGVTIDEDAVENDPGIVLSLEEEETVSFEEETVIIAEEEELSSEEEIIEEVIEENVLSEDIKEEESLEETIAAENTEEALIEEEEKVIEAAEEKEDMYFYDDSTDVIVSVIAPYGAFESDTKMIVMPVDPSEVFETVAGTLEDDITGFQAVDISFHYEDEEVEPRLPIRVSLSSKLISESNDPKIVHIDNNGDPSLMEKMDENDYEVVFESKEFSTYVVVVTTKYITDEGDTYKVTVTLNDKAGLNGNVHLEVSEITGEAYQEYYHRMIETLGFDGLSFARIFDISILDEAGNKLQPAGFVDVKMELLEDELISDNTSIVHFEGADERPHLLSADANGNSVSFVTDGFSAYAIVNGPEADNDGWMRVSFLNEVKEYGTEGLYIGHTAGYYLMNEVRKYNNSNVYGIAKTAKSDYPDGGAEKYYFEQVSGYEDRFYIYTFDAQGNKVYIYNSGNDSLYLEESQKSVFTLRVQNGTFVLNVSNNRYLNMWGSTNGNIFAAYTSADAGSNFYFWHYEKDETADPYELDGKTYGLMRYDEGTNGKALMNTVLDAGSLEGLALTVMSKTGNKDRLFVPDSSEISLWSFEHIESDNYYISSIIDGNRRYLNISGEGLSLRNEKESASVIRVIPGLGIHAGQICLKAGNDTLTYNGKIENGFGVNGSAGNEWFSLVELSELSADHFMTHTASKVSVSDENITNGSRIIVYTRVWNDAEKKYEYYAVGSDGSLVRVYESGDEIEWVGERLNALLWNFVEYYWEGTSEPNQYYELYNQYSEMFIAPQKSEDQILSDQTIGINLNGRRDGKYYTPILAWDDDYYAYAGLKADVKSGKVVSCSMNEADDFYFAIMQEVLVDDRLITIPTIDNAKYGITMRMVNFGRSEKDDTNGRNYMSSFLGSDNGYKNGNTEDGLLNSRLGNDGYPISKAGNSLSSWFAGAQEVNHLFIESTYSGTGYFEYNSVENFAHLINKSSDKWLNEGYEMGDFVLYKQIGTTDSQSGKFYTHGQFFPYNDLSAGVFSIQKNLTDALGRNLPDSDPRKYEQLYQVQNPSNPDYYMGMELEAMFTQTPDGLDEWGHDIIYEFTGDDDFWLYVDGELIIDLGGIHDALAGSVNYRTGEVIVNGKYYTLRQLFEKNYRQRNPRASQSQVNAYLDEYFKSGTSIFKDYTSHTMRIFYFERGAGASNLHMRFNLASIRPDTVQLSKVLSGIDEAGSVQAQFPYQIFYKDAVGNERRLSNAIKGDPYKTTDYVLYKGTNTPVSYEKGILIDGIAYEDVFFLKPGETAEISFPDSMSEYKIRECGVNTEVFETVSVNGYENYGTFVKQGRKDYEIAYVTSEERARVIYDNRVDPSALRTISFEKKIFDESGRNEILNDTSEFNFRLYLSTEYSELEAARMHTYHIKDENGNYCYWDVENRCFASLGEGKNEFSSLSKEEKEMTSFATSLNGAISRIQRGYTIEICNVLAGTKFKIEERETEIPDGYSFQRYDYYADRNDEEYVTYNEIENGVQDLIIANKDPHIVIRNLKGFGLRINKTFNDAEYMEERDAAYFAVFVKGELLINSIRQMPYTENTLYYFWLRLPINGSNFEDYVGREVEITGSYTVDEEGYVSLGKDSAVTAKENGDSISMNGIQKGEEQKGEFTYTVTNEGRQSDNVRLSEITNSRPGIVLRKSDENGNALKGAEFELSLNEKIIGTFTSDENGYITTAFLSPNKEYILKEIKAPKGYHGLEEELHLTLKSGKISISPKDAEYYTLDESDGITITIRNDRYTFKAVKSDAGDREAMAGVHFSLHKQHSVDGVIQFDPSPMVGYEDLITGADGSIPKINETLNEGVYELRELETLEGYQLLDSYIRFSISETGKIELLIEVEGVSLVSESNENGMEYVLNILNAQNRVLSFQKVDIADSSALEGAEFELYTIDDEETPLASLSSNEEGMMEDEKGNTEFEVAVGDYKLIETKAPQGYIKKQEPVIIRVRNQGVTYEEGTNLSKSGKGVKIDETSSTVTLLISNSSGIALPHTGGIGTGIFKTAGLSLIAVSILLAAKKRRS